MNLGEFLSSVKNSIPGISSLSISDRDGVQVYPPSEAVTENQLLAVIFNLTHEQVQKLSEFGETDYLLTEHESGSSLLQVNASPLQISIKAFDVPQSVLVDAGSKIREAISDLRRELATGAQ